MSNAERQRLFQQRHPGYDRRRKARQRAGNKNAGVRWNALLAAAATAESAALPAPVEVQASRVILTLPAPVVVSGLDTFEMPVRKPVPTFIPVGDSNVR